MDLASALSSAENTAIYLDTSSLVWLYRLTTGARTEFIDWAAKGHLETKVHIPAWSLHELYKHRRSPDTLLPFRPKAREIVSSLSFVKESANLFADDGRAQARGFKDRQDYLDFLHDASGKMERALGMLTDNVEMQKVEGDILPFLHARALTSRIDSFSALKEEFLARSEGRVPPGYRDTKKRGDDPGNSNQEGANRFGDYVFWHEVLSHAKINESIKTIVIVTHDQKDDWIYYPDRYKDYDGKIKPNSKKPKTVTCPHPFLGFEAQSLAGASELYIVTIPQLIQVISSHINPSIVQQLARAVQIEAANTVTRPGESGQLENSGLDEAPSESVEQPDNAPAEPDPPEPIPAIEAPIENEIRARLDKLGKTALADAHFLASLGPDPDADAIIRALKSHDWYTQNPAVKKLLNLLPRGTASDDQIFVIGRNLYQAACGNAWAAVQAVQDIKRLLQQLPDEIAALFFAGMLFEAYFDKEGALRMRPKNELLEALFLDEPADPIKAAMEWFQAKIGIAKSKYLRLPGDLNHPEVFTIELNQENALVRIHVRGIEVTREVVDEFDWDSLPDKVSHDQLLRRVAEHFALPKSYVQMTPTFEGHLEASKLALIDWGPDTEVTFAI
jgi:hypothetical protein